MADLSAALKRILFAEGEPPVFALLDGASAPKLLENLVPSKLEHYCLLPGRQEPDLAHVAPYIVQLRPDAEFTQWVLTEGWGQHWGVLLTSAARPIDLRFHFRKQLQAQTEQGKRLMFRYYDPRVLRLFLPKCRLSEAAQFFGPAESFLLESEKPETALRFKLAAGELAVTRVELSAAAAAR